MYLNIYNTYTTYIYNIRKFVLNKFHTHPWVQCLIVYFDSISCVVCLYTLWFTLWKTIVKHQTMRYGCVVVCKNTTCNLQHCTRAITSWTRLHPHLAIVSVCVLQTAFIYVCSHCTETVLCTSHAEEYRTVVCVLRTIYMRMYHHFDHHYSTISFHSQNAVS